MAENWLKDYGFTALQLPRRNLNPGDVLYRSDGSFDTKVGALSDLFQGAASLDLDEDEPVAAISRSLTTKVDAHLGLRILGALFGAAASSKLGANTDVKHAKTVSVTYDDVTQDSVGVIALQTWLERVRVDTARQAMVWLNEGRLAAIACVLRTPRLTIAAQRDNGAAIAFSVPEIQGIVSAGAEVSADSGSTAKITFTGTKPIAFGFQAFKLLFDGNVSFGIEQIRGKTDENPADHAWKPEEAVEQVADGSLPQD